MARPVVWLSLASLSAACTDTWVELAVGASKTSPQPWAFSARTLDDTKLYPATLESNPRGSSYVADAPEAPGGGLNWTNKYGFVGVTWAGSTPGVYDDGLNEHGLSVAQNQLDESVYPTVTAPSRAVGMRSVVSWLLGSAASVREARGLLCDPDGVQVWGREGGGPGGDAGAERQHLHLLDASGDTLLVEWMDGRCHLYGPTDGAWRTVTNSPDFATMRAMRRYEQNNTAPTVLNGVPLAFDSWSRQQRVALVNRARPKLNTTAQAVAWAFKLLDLVSIPGVAGMPWAVAGVPMPADGADDFTQWQLVRDHHERALYSRTWDNLLPKRLHLADVDFSRGAQRRVFAMGGGAFAGEMSEMSEMSEAA